jgi:hypothetical protein
MDMDFTGSAQRIWRRYVLDHDLEDLRGKVAAVEPQSGRVWIGNDAIDAVQDMNNDGVDAPAWFVRIGYDYLDVKGSR